MLNDPIVFKKIKEGDIKAFEQVFRQYYSPLCLYAFGITGRYDTAEEIVQELFYTIWKERESIQIFRSLSSYLYGAVRNQSLLYCEHRNVQERHRESVLGSNDETAGQTPHQQLEYKELQEVINNTLKKLPQRRLAIFRMHRIEGLKYKDIADRLSVSVKTVEAEMTKAYRTLRHEIDKYTRTL